LSSPSSLHCDKKKAITTMLPLPYSLRCNKRKEGSGAKKATVTMLSSLSLLCCKKKKRRWQRCCCRLFCFAATKKR
jgi:hypothetical protein